MFDIQKIREMVAAGLLAIILSTTAITAAVGPAIETGPSLRAPAQVA
jgi:hypothetical protein